MGTLNGKVAAITGATAGIGAAIAKAYHDEGARVVVTGRDANKGKLFLEELQAGDDVQFLAGDASKKADVEELVAHTIEHFGQLDIMVINAGLPKPIRFVEATDEDHRQQFDLNLNQVVWAMRSSLQHMIPRKTGRILAISSLEGKIGTLGMALYSAAKHGIHGLVKSVAKEVGADGITINGICPGVVVTPAAEHVAPAMMKLLGYDSPEALFAGVMRDSAIGRPVTVEECASMAVYLASDAAGAMTGNLINVDGGVSPY
jgi:3-hydroxybutyrate dehydrogenase/3-oxoacyl-[acyl-carrier protein] reductase